MGGCCRAACSAPRPAARSRSRIAGRAGRALVGPLHRAKSEVNRPRKKVLLPTPTPGARERMGRSSAIRTRQPAYWSHPSSPAHSYERELLLFPKYLYVPSSALHPLTRTRCPHDLLHLSLTALNTITMNSLSDACLN